MRFTPFVSTLVGAQCALAAPFGFDFSEARNYFSEVQNEWAHEAQRWTPWRPTFALPPGIHPPSGFSPVQPGGYRPQSSSSSSNTESAHTTIVIPSTASSATESISYVTSLASNPTVATSSVESSPVVTSAVISTSSSVRSSPASSSVVSSTPSSSASSVESTSTVASTSTVEISSTVASSSSIGSVPSFNATSFSGTGTGVVPISTVTSVSASTVVSTSSLESPITTSVVSGTSTIVLTESLTESAVTTIYLTNSSTIYAPTAPASISSVSSSDISVSSVSASSAPVSSPVSPVALNSTSTVFAPTAPVSSSSVSGSITSIFVNSTISVLAPTAPVTTSSSVDGPTSAPINTTVVASTATVVPFPANSTSASVGPTGTAPAAPANTTAPLSNSTDCSAVAASLKFDDLNVTVISSTYFAAGATINIEGGQSICGASATGGVDMCRVALTVSTSPTNANETYMEVWLPSKNGSTTWNGRIVATDNGGLNGCVRYDHMAYVNSLGFAAVGDNGGYNNSAFDGTRFLDNNDLVLDFSYRSRHAAIGAGKQVVAQYYSQDHSYSYYLGCSTGGRQGMKSAQMYPSDFDGIIAGSAAADYNHLEDWTGRFILLTGTDSSDPRFLTQDDWQTVHDEVLAQCDEPLDGVADGILEDPTICNFNATKLDCSVVANGTACLTSTQVTTVYNVYTPLYDQDGNLLYPGLSPGAELESASLGVLTGAGQGIVHDWFAYGVWNNPDWSLFQLNQTDYTEADNLDAYHGNISSWDGDLSGLQASGSKMLIYHGGVDPVIPLENAQRYYLHVASTMGLSPTELDPFYRLFRISGMAHCLPGEAGGPGAWAFGQDEQSAQAGDNVIWDVVDWVENGNAPDVITGTKWFNDDPSEGVEFERSHCRFPYRTTYKYGGLNPNVTTSWDCELIENWQDCGVGALPRLC